MVSSREKFEKALRILETWKLDAEEYPSWAYQYREKVYEAIALLKLYQGEPVEEGSE